ncbi:MULTISPECIES: hypothetical protein [unclassified Tardiphaga]|uniref:hypothetical protein n=1 Tax=unclassified Tardiphaga TaxID=2631404 RepID=UPI00349FF630
MARGFVYLAAVLDWATRRVLSWRLRSASRRCRTLWRATASRRFAIPTRVRSSPARPSPECLPTTASRSAWTATAPGGTTCSSSGCGEASNTRRSTCGPTTASAKRDNRSAGIWIFTTAESRIRVLTAGLLIRPTSTRCLSAWQPNSGRSSAYRRGDSVQTTGTTSGNKPCPLFHIDKTLPGGAGGLTDISEMIFRAALKPSR